MSMYIKLLRSIYIMDILGIIIFIFVWLIGLYALSEGYDRL